MPAFLAALPAALRFLTRLPIPVFAFEDAQAAHDAPDMERLAPALPVAGALIGVAGALGLLLGHALGLGSFLSATLATAVLAAVTGAFHEDGLADFADGLGGATRERRLEIMKDSRVGSFGVVALVLAFALRIGALEGLLDAGPGIAAAGLVAASGIARLGGVWVLAALPPARSGGLSGSAGRPGDGAVAQAAAAGIVIAIGLIVPTVHLIGLIAALVSAAAVVFGTSRLAAAQLGGQTGDVAGAAATLGEIAFLLALLIFARQP